MLPSWCGAKLNHSEKTKGVRRQLSCWYLDPWKSVQKNMFPYKGTLRWMWFMRLIIEGWLFPGVSADPLFIPYCALLQTAVSSSLMCRWGLVESTWGLRAVNVLLTRPSDQEPAGTSVIEWYQGLFPKGQQTVGAASFWWQSVKRS